MDRGHFLPRSTLPSLLDWIAAIGDRGGRSLALLDGHLGRDAAPLGDGGRDAPPLGDGGRDAAPLAAQPLHAWLEAPESAQFPQVKG